MNLGFRKAFDVVSGGTLISSQGLDKTSRYKRKKKNNCSCGTDSDGKRH